eukprot:4843086-Amphidinium_carterae.1
MCEDELARSPELNLLIARTECKGPADSRGLNPRLVVSTAEPRDQGLKLTKRHPVSRVCSKANSETHTELSVGSIVPRAHG